MYYQVQKSCRVQPLSVSAELIILWIYSLQAMYSSTAVKSWGPVHIWTPLPESEGVRTPRPPTHDRRHCYRATRHWKRERHHDNKRRTTTLTHLSTALKPQQKTLKTRLQLHTSILSEGGPGSLIPCLKARSHACHFWTKWKKYYKWVKTRTK